MILVFASSIHGGYKLGDYHIPGYCDRRPPTRIPFSLYWKNREILIQAPYTKQRLEAIFGGEFPNIIFNQHDIGYLNHQQLVFLCRALGIASSKLKSTKARRKAIREFLKEYG
jgi:hypothetical protein